MAKTWDHLQWGSFAFNGYAYANKVAAPAFDAFVYQSKYSAPAPPTGSYELAFDAEDESDVPSETAVALAAAVLANHAMLVPLVTTALWDDFNGDGPDSGMWWNGDLESVSEDIEPAPEGPDDLLKLMRLQRIVVRKKVYGYEKPVATLDFNAEFEDEHGVGILTDGQTILGAGYSADVSPYH
ncbi:MAG: hypothetical protein H7145_12080 [Akkermansiaceae bacterium]|nr:hypothetical protein [Armatimonadota bacterium]